MKFKIEYVAMALSIIAFGVAAVSGWVYFDNRSKTQMSDGNVRNVIVANQANLYLNSNDVVLGNPDGDVTLVEFSDYRCSACKLAHPIVMKLLQDDGNIRYVVKEYPILGPVSVVAARAALASQKQGGYADFSNALMAARTFDEARIFAIATEVGLDANRLRADMAAFEGDISATLAANADLAKELALQGTPAFVAGHTLVPGATSLAGLNHLIGAARDLNAAN